MKTITRKSATLILSAAAAFCLSGCGSDDKDVTELITTVTLTSAECEVVPNYTLETARAIGAVIYTITGGTDAASFSVDAGTGVVSYIGATPDFETQALYTYDVSAMDASGASAAQTVRLNITDFSITHNGTTYSCVTNDTTNEVWLDRNLGAAQICESPTDTSCYGDYYQWGRNFDGHQDSTAGTTTTLAADVTTVGHANFILTNASPYDWSAPGVDDDGAIRTANWSKIDGSSVCPVGYRLPTEPELKAERLSWSSNNSEGAFASPLKLPLSGSNNRNNGFSVRCLKD